MSSGGSRTTTQVQSNDPWAPSQEYLKDAMGTASDYLEEGSGFNPYGESTVVPYSDATNQALEGTLSQAGAGTPGTDAALGSVTGLAQDGGITAGQYYEPIARGDDLANPNPYLMESLGRGADDIQNRIGNEAAAYGRSGSGAMADRMGDSLGDYYSGALSRDYENARNRQMQGIAGLSGVQGSNAATQMQAAGMIPGLEQSQYSPYERMGDVGTMYDDLATREKADEVRLYEGEENADWNRLQNAMGIFSGGGQLGGTSSATVTQPSASPWTQALGAGLTGLGAFGSFF